LLDLPKYLLKRGQGYLKPLQPNDYFTYIKNVYVLPTQCIFVSSGPQNQQRIFPSVISLYNIK
jgi:hypothetical protein